MAILNYFGKNQKAPKEEEYDNSYYNPEDELSAAQPEANTSYEKPAPAPRSTYTATQSAPMQMKIVRPSSFYDGQTIANFLMENHPVLIHLEHATKEVAHDLVCFLTGVVFAIGGQIQPVSESTYMLSPGSMEITEENIVAEGSDENAAGNGDGYGYSTFGGFDGYNY